MENPWMTKKVKEIYQNDWIKVEEHDVLDPSGKDGIYGIVHLKSIAIAILPLDEDDHTWLVGQYRYPLGRYSWELPEGGGDLDVDPLKSAARELKEETGIVAKKWKKILEMDLSNSVTDEHSISYVARDLSFFEPEPEDTEVLRVIRIPFEEAVKKVIQGEITDALSVGTLLQAQILKMKGLL